MRGTHRLPVSFVEWILHGTPEATVCKLKQQWMICQEESDNGMPMAFEFYVLNVRPFFMTKQGGGVNFGSGIPGAIFASEMRSRVGVPLALFSIGFFITCIFEIFFVLALESSPSRYRAMAMAVSDRHRFHKLCAWDRRNPLRRFCTKWGLK